MYFHACLISVSFIKCLYLWAGMRVACDCLFTNEVNAGSQNIKLNNVSAQLHIW
jgi:hypothetical protein